MSLAKITTLLCACLNHERHATSPAGRQYWTARYRHFRALASQQGWMP